MTAIKQVQWGSVPVSLNQLALSDRIFVLLTLMGTMIWAFPHIALAQSLQNTPIVFEINNLNLLSTQEDYLAKVLTRDVYLPKPYDPRVELLREYLERRKSPLVDSADVLLEQYHYRLILGISFAESNFCKYQIRPNNCWGIGGTRPEKYNTPKEGIIRANNLIERYHNNGMTTPKLMRNTWVGWQNNSWIVAVEQITKDLENLGL